MRLLAVGVGLLALLAGVARAGTWTQITNAPPSGLVVMLLLTDGTVMAQGDDTISWYQLKPDIHGSYVNGTWSTLAAMHDTRLYNSLQVLRDGRVFVAGAEYGTGSSTAEVFDPLTNTWTLTPASGQNFVDSVSELLGDGRVLVAPVSPSVTRGTVIYDPAANTWSAGPTALRRQEEVPWLKLPDGSILSVDGTNQAERFIPALNQWVADANTPDVMYIGSETGCGHMLANGTAFFRGYTHTALYTPSGSSAPGSWAAGPDIPGGLNCGDTPGAVLPNSHVLFAAGPGYLTGPPSFFEYDPVAKNITPVDRPAGMTLNIPPYTLTMLTLPDGEVLMKAGAAVYEYVSTSGTADTNFQPTISSISRNLDGSHHLAGTNLNGFTEGAAYGDDFQMATNYPLVRLTDGEGNVYFARTFNWSSTALQTGTALQSTEFTLPPDAPDGTYALAVIASGIASAPVTLSIPDTAGDAAPTVATPVAATPGSITGTTTALSVLGADNDSGGEPSLTYTWRITAAPSGAAPSLSSNGTNAAKNTTATFHQAGSYTLMVTIRDVEGLSVSSSVSVTVSQTLSAVVVVPGTTNLSAGQALQLSATGLDQFGVPLAAQPTFTWAMAAGGGSVSNAGIYTAPGGGTLASVTATAGGCSDTATVAVISTPWISADIGTPVLTGTASDSGDGTFTLSAAGSGISGSADQFHFAYRNLCGDGVITARVATQQNTADRALAGVMIRASTEAGAAQALMAITPGHGAAFQFRTGTNLSNVNSNSSGPTAPYWVRLVRSGNTITGYTAPDGTTWTQQGAVNIPMTGAALLMGLVVTSTDPQNLCMATFDHISVLTAQNDALSVAPGGTGTVNVLANDTGPVGTALTVSAFTQGELGTVVDTGGGVLQYTPLSGTAADTDSFTYTVSDGQGDTATATVVINGVLAWYKFDEGSGTTSADATGDGHTCTLSGTTWTSGIQGTGALSYTGTSSSTASIPALNLNTNTLTLTGWVRRSGTQNPFAGLVFCRAGMTACGLHLGTANELRYTWNNAAETFNYSSGLTVPDAQWTFVALVVTPENATLYLQPQGGTLQSAVNPVANAAAAFDGATTLGQDPASSTRCFLGALDEVRIYNTPLSMAQIAALAVAIPTVARAAVAAPATVTSTNTALSALGASTVFPESALRYTWATTTLPAGASAPAFTINDSHAARNTAVLFSQAGSYTFAVTIADTSGSAATSSVAVTVNQTLTSVNVSASTPVIGAQITQQFAAAALDQFGHNLAVQPTFIWTSTGYGSVDSDGLFTTPYASGVASVSASYSGISSANIDVTANTPWKTWVTSTFSADEALDPAVSGPQANPSGDGITNLLKYALNADPKAATPHLLPMLAVDGDNITFTYPQNVAATDLTYVVEQSQDLTTWTAATPSATNVLSDDGFTSLLQATFPRGTATKLLLRLRVVTP